MGTVWKHPLLTLHSYVLQLSDLQLKSLSTVITSSTVGLARAYMSDFSTPAEAMSSGQKVMSTKTLINIPKTSSPEFKAGLAATTNYFFTQGSKIKIQKKKKTNFSPLLHDLKYVCHTKPQPAPWTSTCLFSFKGNDIRDVFGSSICNPQKKKNYLLQGNMDKDSKMSTKYLKLSLSTPIPVSSP